MTSSDWYVENMTVIEDAFLPACMVFHDAMRSSVFVVAGKARSAIVISSSFFPAVLSEHTA